MKTFTGIVQKGDMRGRELGYPTINIPLSGDTAGVFAARVRVADESPYQAAAFADPERGVLEAHLLDFSDDLYGLTVKIELCEKIRETQRFSDDSALKAAIASDVAKVREYFKN